MADKEIVNPEDKDSQILWIAPYIFQPGADTVVNPGFLIDAIVTVPVATQWRIQFYYNADLIREFRGTPVLGTGIVFNVPHDLIRPGAGFYFRLDYAKRVGFWDTWSDWAYSGNLKMAGGVKPPVPQITAPAQGSKHPVGRVEIRGTCSAGATAVDILSWDNSQLGDAFVSGTHWSYSRDWDTGTKHVKARQWVNGTPSDPGAQREFLIGAVATPPSPHIFTPTEGDTYGVGSIGLSGTCLNDAKVEVLNGDNSKLGDAIVSGTTWSYTRYWDAGAKHVKVRQIVDDMPSQPSAQREFFVVAMSRPPAPTIVAPLQGSTHQSGYMTVHGTCLQGAQVELLNFDDSKLATADVGGTVWSHGRIWDEGKKHFKVTQTLNHWRSEASPLREFYVGTPPKPARPTITAPANGSQHPVGNLTVRGTCVAGATVEVLSSDNVKLGDAEVIGTSWAYTRSWTQGAKHVKARQKIYGVDSDPTDIVGFHVGTPSKPQRPTITAPANGSLHPVGDVPVRGTCVAGATVEVLSSDNVKLGDAEVIGTSWAYTRSWTQGSKHVKARQKIYGVDSDPTDIVVFHVGTPSKPQRPTITAPRNGSQHPIGEITVRGTCVEEAVVEVLNADNSKLADAVVTGANWAYTGFWTMGAKHVRARQRLYGIDSDPTEVVQFDVGRPERPTITAPAMASQHPIGDVMISGTCLEGATVELLNFDDSILGDAVVTGTLWSYTYSGGSGASFVKARQTLLGMHSRPTDVVIFFVGNKPERPTITEPANGSPYPVGVVAIRGTCVSGAFVSVLNADGSGLGNAAMTGTTWVYRRPWTSGVQQVRARQTYQGIDSDATDIVEFYVVDKPEPPTISPPPNPAAAREELTVLGIFPGKVTLEMFCEAGTTIVGTFSTSGTTSTFTPSTNWATGVNKVYVVQAVSGVASDPSDVCTFTVEAGKPDAPRFERPAAGSTTSPRPVIRLAGLPEALFTLRHAGGETLFAEKADALGILEHTPATPFIPGAIALEVKQESGGSESDWSEPHLFVVKELPPTPMIDAPTEGSFNPRRPTVRGKGQTGGKINLRHADDPENLIGSINGVMSWRWTAPQLWDIGTYIIQVQQAMGEVSSEWSAFRSFEVVDARYGIGDAQPADGHLLVSRDEGVVLRVQVVWGKTGAVVQGVAVEWRALGEQALRETTHTGADGWTAFHFVPDSVGVHTILADLTLANEGVAIVEQFEVTVSQD